MKRERYWGVYNWESKVWSMSEPGKRVRFPSSELAYAFITPVGLCSGYTPRPFYVTRKPRPTHDLIEAVKKFDAGKGGWIDVKKALEKL